MTDDAVSRVREGRRRAVLAAADRRRRAGQRSPQSLFFVNASIDDEHGVRAARRRGSTSSSTSAACPATASTTSPCRRRCSCRPSSSSRARASSAPRRREPVRAAHRREADRPRPRRARSAINDAIAKVFDERQIYRIDHYLGKETVQNILVLRFANSIFEPLFNQKYIDHVQITVAEEEGVGTRAGYYEQAGALRDMVQNHMLQLLALVAMEPPHSLDADVVRDEKLEVLQSLRPIDGDAVDAQRRARAVRGRASIMGAPVPGYRDETGRRRRTRAPRPSSRCRCSSTTGAGPACRSSCAPASGCRSAPARSRSS